MNRVVNRAMSDDVGHRIYQQGMVNTSVEVGSMWQRGGTQSFKFEWFYL